MKPLSSYRHLIVTLVATFAFMGVSRVSFAKKGEVSIGYVNLQRAILEVEEGKRAKAKLKTTFEKKQAALQSKEAELMKLKNAIEKETSVKNDASTRKRLLEFQNKLLDLQKVFVAEQQELQQLEQKALSGITQKMRDIIKNIGQQGGYTLILEVQDSRLLYAKSYLDLTNEVIRKYNTKYK